jgi:DJ-1/PfpI family
VLGELHQAGTAIATVCTGGMVAAAAGLTNGRPATTHHSALDELRASGAHVVDARVVDDGDLIMAGGVTSGIDLALWLVEREVGGQIAAAVAEEMEYPRNAAIWSGGSEEERCRSSSRDPVPPRPRGWSLHGQSGERRSSPDDLGEYCHTQEGCWHH